MAKLVMDKLKTSCIKKSLSGRKNSALSEEELRRELDENVF